MFSFIDWMQQMDEQEERENADWHPSHGFPLGARSYWVVDEFGNQYGEAIVFYKGDGRVFARLILTTSMSAAMRNELLQTLYDQFDYFHNLECTVLQSTNLGTFETVKPNLNS